MDLMTIVLMVLVIGGAVIGARDWYTPVFSAIALAIGGLVLGVGLYALVSTLVNHTPIYEQHDLLSLQDGSETQGSFFLGIGSVDGVQMYSYYQDNGEWAEWKSTKAENVRVYQDTDKPYIVQEKDCISHARWLVDCATDKRVTEIHVPVGSIKTNFTLDAR